MTLRELIQEALAEAEIMEWARNIFSLEGMLLNAMRLSGAPYSFVREVYSETVIDAE